MQVGALFAYPSAQCTGRFFAVVRTLLPVMIAELLFWFLSARRNDKCAHIATQMARFAFLSARGRRFGAHLGTLTAKAHQMHAMSTI